jgi:hypothetical protein
MPVSILAKRAFTLPNVVEVAVKDPPEEGAVEI